jgi:hypothetical protein
VTRFEYAVINEDGIEVDRFRSDDEYQVGDRLARESGVWNVERVEDASLTEWRGKPESRIVSRRLHCSQYISTLGTLGVG